VRRPIPPNARAAFDGRKEYLRTLGTKDLGEAKRLAFRVLAEVQERIDRAMSGAVFWQTHDMHWYLVRLAEWSGWQLRQFDSATIYETRDAFLEDLAEFAGAELAGIPPMDLDDFRRYVEDEADDLYPGPSAPGQPPAQAAKRVRLSELQARLLNSNDYEVRSAMDTRNVFGLSLP
jgi:hypothetical protein